MFSAASQRIFLRKSLKELKENEKTRKQTERKEITENAKKELNAGVRLRSQQAHPNTMSKKPRDKEKQARKHKTAVRENLYQKKNWKES